MNEGVEIAPDVAAGTAVAHHRPGHERRRRPHGAALPARRASRRTARAHRRVGRATSAHGDGPRHQPRLARRSGRAGARARARSSSATASSRRSTWLDGDDADGIDDRGVVVAPGFIDLHAHLREPGNEDAETVATGLAAAAHGGFTTVCAMPNTTPALDEPAVLARVRAAASRPARRCGCWPYGAVTAGRAGETLAALGELADAGVVGFSDDGSPVGSAGAPAQRARVRGRARAADRRPPGGRDADRRRRGERGLRRDGPGAARLAGGGRGRRPSRGTSRSSPTSCGTCRARDCTSPTSRPPGRSSSSGAPRPRACRSPATSRRTTSPSPTSGSPARGAGPGMRSTTTAQRAIRGRDGAIDGRARTRPSLRVNPPLRSRRATRPPASRRCSTAPPTRSPPTTPRIRWSTRTVEFGLAANGISGIETALGLLLAAVDAGSLPLARAIAALTTGPAAVLGRLVRRAAPSGSSRAPRPTSSCSIDRSRWTVSRTSLASKGKNTPLLGRDAARAGCSSRWPAGSSPTRRRGLTQPRRPRDAACTHARLRCRRMPGRALNTDYERRPYWHATMPALPDRRDRPLPDSGRRRRGRWRIHGDHRGPRARPAWRIGQPARGARRSASAPRRATAGSSIPGYKWGTGELVPRYGEETGARPLPRDRSTRTSSSSDSSPTKASTASSARAATSSSPTRRPCRRPPQGASRRLASFGVEATVRAARAAPRGDRVGRVLRRPRRRRPAACSIPAKYFGGLVAAAERAGADLHEGVRARPSAARPTAGLSSKRIAGRSSRRTSSWARTATRTASSRRSGGGSSRSAATSSRPSHSPRNWHGSSRRRAGRSSTRRTSSTTGTSRPIAG